MATRMQQRRGTASQWTTADPILAAGEIGFETDTGKFKIGDGTSVWSTLSYFADAQDFDSSNLIPQSDKGAVNGVATLDATGNVPVSQLGKVIATAPALLDTLAELASAVNSDPNFSVTVDAAINSAVNGAASALASHEADTTNVHGIADTAALETQTGAQDKADAAKVDAVGEAANYTDARELIITAAYQAYADQAELDAISFAVSTAATAAEADATAKANLAESNAVTTANAYTDSEIDTLDTALQGTINTTISDHAAVTVNVHGIADTQALETQTGAQDKADAAQSAAEAYADSLAANYDSSGSASSAVSTHNSLTENVHGIADTSVLVVQADLDALTTDDIAEGANEYYTDAKAIAANASAIATAKSEAIADATAQVNAIIASAPTALDTLDELAAALGDDANFAATVTTALDGKVASYTPISQKTAAYTLSSLTERDSLIEVNSSSAVTVTIPTNASVAYPVGTSLDILQTGTGQVTIAGAGGVTVNATPGLKLRTQWSSATLFKRAENTWVVYGDLSA